MAEYNPQHEAQLYKYTVTITDHQSDSLLSSFNHLQKKIWQI